LDFRKSLVRITDSLEAVIRTTSSIANSRVVKFSRIFGSKLFDTARRAVTAGTLARQGIGSFEAEVESLLGRRKS
jgi:hypothetical protein